MLGIEVRSSNTVLKGAELEGNLCGGVTPHRAIPTFGPLRADGRMSRPEANTTRPASDRLADGRCARHPTFLWIARSLRGTASESRFEDRATPDGLADGRQRLSSTLPRLRAPV